MHTSCKEVENIKQYIQLKISLFTCFNISREKGKLSLKYNNSVLQTGLMIRIGRRKEMLKVTFRALGLCRNESRNYALCVVYIHKDVA